MGQFSLIFLNKIFTFAKPVLLFIIAMQKWRNSLLPVYKPVPVYRKIFSREINTHNRILLFISYL